jgi:hypothetical protein
LSLACRRHGLASSYGRGFDDLPAEVRARFAGGLSASLERDALLAVLNVVAEAVIKEARDLPDGAPKVEMLLRELVPPATLK